LPDPWEDEQRGERLKNRSCEDRKMGESEDVKSVYNLNLFKFVHRVDMVTGIFRMERWSEEAGNNIING
jgi:hypothetical protein